MKYRTKRSKLRFLPAIIAAATFVVGCTDSPTGGLSGNPPFPVPPRPVGIGSPGTSVGTSTGATTRGVTDAPPPRLNLSGLSRSNLVAVEGQATVADVQNMLAKTRGSGVSELPRTPVDSDVTSTEDNAVSAESELGISQVKTEEEGTGGRTSAEEEEELLADTEELEDQGDLYEAASTGTVGFHVQQVIPARADLRLTLGAAMPRVRDQGKVKMGPFFAAIAAMDIAYAQVPGAPIKEGSPRFLYWLYHHYVVSRVPSEAGNAFQDVGADPNFLAILQKEGNLTPSAHTPFLNRNLGYVSEADVPTPATLPDLSNLIPDARAGELIGEAMVSKIRNKQPITTQGAFFQRTANNNATFKAVLSGGLPLLISLPSSQDWGNPLQSKGFAIDEPTPQDNAQSGAHMVVLVGYQDDAAAPGGGYYTLRNSWGEGWADKGYARISYQFVHKYAWSPMVPVIYPASYQGEFTVEKAPDFDPGIVAGKIILSPTSVSLIARGPDQEIAYSQPGTTGSFKEVSSCFSTELGGELATITPNANKTAVTVRAVAGPGTCELIFTGPDIQGEPGAIAKARVTVENLGVVATGPKVLSFLNDFTTQQFAVAQIGFGGPFQTSGCVDAQGGTVANVVFNPNAGGSTQATPFYDVTPLKLGTCTVTITGARAETGTVTVQVTALISSLELTAPVNPLGSRGTYQLNLVAKDSRGEIITGQFARNVRFTVSQRISSLSGPNQPLTNGMTFVVDPDVGISRSDEQILIQYDGQIRQSDPATEVCAFAGPLRVQPSCVTVEPRRSF